MLAVGSALTGEWVGARKCVTLRRAARLWRTRSSRGPGQAMNWFLTFYRGRFVIRTRDTFRCVDCDHEYHPQVQAPAGLVLVIALPTLLAAALVFALWLLDRALREWILWAKAATALVVLGVSGLGAWLQSRVQEGRAHTYSTTGTPAFGEIVLNCPKCGSQFATAEESESVRAPRSSDFRSRP